MGFGMLLWWGLLIAVVVVAIRALAVRDGSGESRTREGSPIDILGARYARGEIDRSEFEERRRDLSGR